MAPRPGWLRRLAEHVGADREQIDADDTARSLSALRGLTTPLAGLPARERVRVGGVLRAVTYPPAALKPVLVGQLFDGTGSVDLVWLGRRSIAGIAPGTRLMVEGTVVAGRARSVIYNPSYEILGRGR
ncbi:MAG: OB-fold nucleic acid binding domain-containing protein [Actinomyces sp.]|uniref:OB-fold nucleic acid binding domain-containing protein n=1 Tax=Actinomyces sp. TaxID=29317 RepID=UPI0026DBB16A|nr:OB-fold nucleic acid binding domain-containing protein [Actinomyces sp.]MDO4243426.1 OB-fold nucleic acid binding domain-containing protein [Actinomyces sp.]